MLKRYILLFLTMKLKYIRGFIICKQYMATNGVKNIRSSANPTVSNISVLILTMLGVRRLANYPNCMWFAGAEAI